MRKGTQYLLTESSITHVCHLCLSPFLHCFLASCLRPAGVRVKQTLFGVSRTEWLVLAWKPVFFPRATKSLRNRWDARNYLFPWFYSGLKDSKSATRITTTVFYTLTVSFFRVPMSDQRSNVDVLIFPFFFKPYFVFCCFFLYWNLSAHLEDIKLTERQVKSKLFCWGKKNVQTNESVSINSRNL